MYVLNKNRKHFFGGNQIYHNKYNYLNKNINRKKNLYKAIN